MGYCALFLLKNQLLQHIFLTAVISCLLQLRVKVLSHVNRLMGIYGDEV